MLGATLVLAGLSVLIGLAAAPLFAYSERAAADLLAGEAYVRPCSAVRALPPAVAVSEEVPAMSYLALNLMLAIVWMFLSGTFGLGSLLAGYGVGFLSLAILQPVVGSQQYVQGMFGVMRLLVIYMYELMIAAVQLARDILRPNPPIRGGFLHYDARHLSPAKTVLLSNMLSLTPGTLTVDVDDDGRHTSTSTPCTPTTSRRRDVGSTSSPPSSRVCSASRHSPTRKEFDRWRPS
jgi:multicomponent Na+:H+ antiporter subunit E